MFVDWGTIAVSLTSAIVGGAVAHYFSLYRERESKRRDLVTRHLVEIWQSIEATNKSIEDIPLKRLERPFADIQLFGSDEIIAMTKRVADEIVAHNTADTTELLNKLRNNLRKELGLAPVQQRFFWFRSAPQEFSHIIKSNHKR